MELFIPYLASIFRRRFYRVVWPLSSTSISETGGKNACPSCGHTGGLVFDRQGRSGLLDGPFRELSSERAV
jgi:hypothetical protein